MRALLVLLTALLAITLPLKFALAWTSPGLAAALDVPYIRSLPALTIGVVTISMVLHALLMVVIVRQVWELAKVFRSGVFFSRENVVRIRRVGTYLLLTGGLGILSPILGIWSAEHSRSTAHWDRVWAQAFNLPFGTLVCGLLALTIARAFDRARRMAAEAKFTV